MYRLRTGNLALVCVAAFAACTKSQPEASLSGRAAPAPAPASTPVVANFEGQYDPATGTFTVAMISPDLTTPGGLSISLPFRDGTTGSNPDNTFEFANDPDPGYAPSTGADVCGAGVSGFEGWVQIQSFFRNQTLRNVHAEITFLSDTNNNGCNSAATAPAGTSNGLGLWSYGDVAPGQTVARAWRFRTVNSQAYTFRGRVMADLDPVVHVSGAPEFDWTPTALLAKKSFKPVGTTTAHLVWDGTTWVNNSGPAITFQKVGTPTSTYSAIPGAPYAAGFTTSNYFIADSAHGGNAINTAGNFTVCAKIKPGAHPMPAGDTIRRIYVAKGKSESLSEGWSLMQMHRGYCYHYRTTQDDARGRGDVMTFVDLAEYSPETYAYDYICGGRGQPPGSVGTIDPGLVGTQIFSMARGVAGTTYREANGYLTNYVDTAFASGGTSLPLVIGAYADATMPAVDGGVYEVIFDSRGASLTVMQEIVAAAENWTLDGSPAIYNLYERSTGLPLSTTPTTLTANDGNSYVLPPDVIVPAALDGTGLLDAGRIVKYRQPVATSTTASGYCLGAEVVPTGTWSGVSGGIVGFADSYDTWTSSATYLVANPFSLHDPGGVATIVTPPAGTDTAAHVFKACIDGTGAPGAVRLYVDGAVAIPAAGASYYAPSVMDLSYAPYIFHIGEGGPAGVGGPLTGARIRRVFACPSSNAASCN